MLLQQQRNNNSDDDRGVRVTVIIVTCKHIKSIPLYENIPMCQLYMN